MMYIKIALCLRAYVEIRIRAAASRDGGYMNPNTQEPGPFSETYFHTPSPLAKKTFLYPVCLGHYYCDEEYCVARNNYDSFLMMLVVKGQGYAESLGEKAFRKKIGEKQLVLMDCYAPHMYGADSEMEFYWIHFDGINAGAYFRYLTEVYGTVITLTDRQTNVFLHKFRMLLEALSSDQGIAENLLGYFVTDLLTFPSGLTGARTVSGSEAAQEDRFTRELGKAVSYMRQHFMEEITIEDLAGCVSVSPYHFIRLFKKQYGITPHQYLLSMRLDCARFYLRSGDKTVKEIAFSCGFQSENNFCVAFKKQTGMTPTNYRHGMETRELF